MDEAIWSAVKGMQHRVGREGWGGGGEGWGGGGEGWGGGGEGWGGGEMIHNELNKQKPKVSFKYSLQLFQAPK